MIKANVECQKCKTTFEANFPNLKVKRNLEGKIKCFPCTIEIETKNRKKGNK